MSTIFVSIASFRDPDCKETLKSLFTNAKHPERVYVGICEQNATNAPNEICSFNDDNVNQEDTNKETSKNKKGNCL